MSQFSTINIGKNTRKYTRDMSYDNNTTLGFGIVQPLLSQHMYADSDINVGYKQLVRLAPLYVPTFGRISVRNEIRFIPTVDLCPYFECIQSGISYCNGTQCFKPSTVPYTDNAFLTSYLLFKHSKWVYASRSSTSTQDYTFSSTIPTGTTFTNLNANLRDKLLITTLSSRFILPSDTYDSSITPESADYIIRISTTEFVFFRLKPSGRRIRTNLIGLGYGLALQDTNNVSILPILAYYKAYFDTYSPQTDDISWQSTNAYVFIKYTERTYWTDFTSDYIYRSNEAFQLFVAVLNDLSSTWFVSSNDFVSSHTVSPTVQHTQLPTAVNDGVASAITMADDKLPSYSASAILSDSAIRALQRLSRWVRADSVIGTKLSDWMRVHFNSDIVNNVFRRPFNVASHSTNIEINDVFSTADTVVEASDSSSASGEYLGSYAGKGIGFDQSGYNYHASVDGYIVHLCSVVPDAGYFQGNNPQLYAINKDTLPIAEFDALGYELTPLASIIDNNGIAEAATDNAMKNNSFGYVPRYTGLKYNKNIVNGDMSRRSTMDSYSAYYMDRIISSQQLLFENKSSNVYTLTNELSGLSWITPNPKWRYLTEYPWLGNFNRIFQSSGVQTKGSGLIDITVESDETDIDDNFTCQTVFDIKVKDFLKPIQDSYDTYEPLFDDSSIKIKAQ